VRRAKNAICELRVRRKLACELTGTKCVRNLNGVCAKVKDHPVYHGQRAQISVFNVSAFGILPLAGYAESVLCKSPAGKPLWQRRGWRWAAELPDHPEPRRKIRLWGGRGMLPAIAPLRCRNCRAPGLGGMILTLKHIAIPLIRR